MAGGEGFADDDRTLSRSLALGEAPTRDEIDVEDRKEGGGDTERERRRGSFAWLEGQAVDRDGGKRREEARESGYPGRRARSTGGAGTAQDERDA